MSRSLLAAWRDAVSDSDRSSSAKLVAHTLTTWMNGTGSCWPSMEEIARRTSLSTRTVARAIEELEAGGLLDVSRSKGRASHLYRTLNHDTDSTSTPTQLPGRRRRTRTNDASNPATASPNLDTVADESTESAELEGALSRARLDGGAANATFDPDEVLAAAAAFIAEEDAER